MLQPYGTEIDRETGAVTIWIDDADALFARLRAGESYTMVRLWDGESFCVADPLDAEVTFRAGPGGSGDVQTLLLATPAFEIDERAEWYLRMGFVEIGEDGDDRAVGAGGLTIWIRDAATSV